jgi:hypothetical protein
MTCVISGDTGVSAVQTGAVQQGDLAANVAGNGPVFKAVVSAVIAVASTFTKCAPFTQEEFDTNNNFDHTSGRFTPTIAGYYQVNGVVNGGGSTVTALTAQLRKNGAAEESSLTSAPAGFSPTASVSGMFYMNGTTDYLELWGRDTNNANFAYCYFSGVLVRAA